MKLINTIELSPYDYSQKEYKSPDPNISLKEKVELWYEYWVQCLSDSNLGHLKPVNKGSHLVEMSTINERDLEIILKKKLTEVDMDDYEEQVGRLIGGIVAKLDDEIIIEPQCCSDIGNLYEWEEIFETEKNVWKNLWIGHPWIFFRRINGQIEFSDYIERNLEDIDEMKIKCTMPENKLKVDLVNMRMQQNLLGEKIYRVLDKMKVGHALEISKIMSGNDFN